MGSFTNINTYAQQTVNFTDEREPGPRIFPPVPLNTVFAFDRPLSEPFPIYMGTQVEQVIRPEDALLNLWINTNDAPGSIVTWENLPTGVGLTNAGGGFYILGPINSTTTWNQIKDGGRIQFTGEGPAVYKVSLQWFDSDEYRVVEWINGTLIPVAVIRSAFGVGLVPNYIFAPRYDWTSEFVFYNLSGKLQRITRNLAAQFAVTAIRTRIRGYSFARTAVFTQSALLGIRKEYNVVVLSTAAAQIVPLRIKNSAVIPINGVFDIYTLGGKIRFADGQFISAADIFCDGIATTIVEYAAEFDSEFAQDIDYIRIRYADSAVDSATDMQTEIKHYKGIIETYAVETQMPDTDYIRYRETPIPSLTAVSTMTVDLTESVMELEWAFGSTNASRSFTVQVFAPTTIDWGNSLTTNLSAGTHTVSAPTGSTLIARINSPQPYRFYGPGSGLKKVNSWNNAGYTQINSMLTGVNLETVPNSPLLVQIFEVDATSMFEGAQKLNCDLDKLFYFVDNRLANTSRMFYNAFVFNGSVDAWNTSSVVNMKQMFFGARQFNKPIGSWNVSSVVDMEEMFYECLTFNQNIGTWNTAALTNMEDMFREAQNFNQSLNTWDVSKVTNMRGVFHGAIRFNGNISAWNTSSVTDMSNMFRDVWNFNQPIGSWNTSNVTNMQAMFWNSGQAEGNGFNQNINTWDVSKVTNMSYMFYDAENFNQPLDQWDTSSVTDMSYMFWDADSFNQNINTWNTSNVTNMTGMFLSANDFNQPLGSWDVRKVSRANMRFMFQSALAYNQDLSTWNVRHISLKPQDFDTGATAWTLPKPNWGIPYVGINTAATMEINVV